MNVLARMRACTNLWKNQCSRNFGKFIKQSDPIRICRNDPPQNQAENDPAETTHGRKPMFNECATSAFQRQGSDRHIGHWSLLPRRATEPIAASLILNIACYQRASADNISRKFGPRSGPTKSLKLIKT